jgi:hypothetical protein
MILLYDADADVLYVTFTEGVKPQSYYENENGDIVRVDKLTGTIVGCTIPFFLKRTADKPLVIPTKRLRVLRITDCKRLEV